MNLRKLAFAFLFALVCVAGTNAQNKKPEIKVEYDKFKDGTFVSFEPVTIGAAKDTTLRLGMLTGFKGQVPKKPNDLMLVFASPSFVETNQYKNNRSLILLADGERYVLGEASYEVKYDMPLYLEVMAVKVPYNTVMKLSEAKKIEMQFGSTEFALNESLIEALRYLAGRIRLQP
jgi:hypothetical protein